MNRRIRYPKLLSPLLLTVLSYFFFSVSNFATAQTDHFPTHSVRLIVPVAAGGSADKLARILGEKLTQKWGQSVIVENIPGASSTIGTNQVVKAKPDGYTLLLGGDHLSLNEVLNNNVPYSPSSDLRGVTKAVANPQLLAVSTKLGVNNFAEFVALLKQRPGEITLGLPGGNGSYQHLAVVILNDKLKTATNNIPYPGGGPVLLDMLGGHIDSTLITLAAATEHVRNKSIVALAVTTPYRSPALPEVPTLQELGVKEYALSTWQGIVAPKAVPDAIIAKLNQDITAVLNEPDIKNQLESLGFKVVASTPEALDADIASDTALFKKVVSEANIKLE